MQESEINKTIFFEEKDKKQAKAEIRRDGDNILFSISVKTPLLIRMGNKHDNMIKIVLDRKKEIFVSPSLYSSDPSIKIKVKILKNNNKESLYNIMFSLPNNFSSFYIEAEGLKESSN